MSLQAHAGTMQPTIALLNALPDLLSLSVSKTELTAATAAELLAGLSRSALSCITSLSISHTRSALAEDCRAMWLAVLLARRVGLQAASGMLYVCLDLQAYLHVQWLRFQRVICALCTSRSTLALIQKPLRESVTSLPLVHRVSRGFAKRVCADVLESEPLYMEISL